MRNYQFILPEGVRVNVLVDLFGAIFITNVFFTAEKDKNVFFQLPPETRGQLKGEVAKLISIADEVEYNHRFESSIYS